MFAKDELKTSTLRLLLSSLKNFEIEKGLNYEATDDDVLTIVSREIKKRKEAIDSYKSANRQDAAEKEEKELKILEEYQPEQMGEEEVRKLVEEAVSQTNASTMQDMGKVMGVLMPKVKGKADGSLVSRIVKERLG